MTSTSFPCAPCAHCGAAALTACIGPDGEPIASIHRERINAGVRATLDAFQAASAAARTAPTITPVAPCAVLAEDDAAELVPAWMPATKGRA